MTNAKDKLVLELKKNFGEHSIIKASQLPSWKVIPFGIPALDFDIGGGIVLGKINMIMGKESSGKSTLCFKLVRQFQDYGVDCYYIDLDKLLEPQRTQVFGVDTEKLVYVSENLNSKLVTDMVVKILQSYNAQDDRRVFIVLDSLAAMASPKTLENIEMSGYNTDDARANNNAFKIWNTTMSRDQTILIVNQYRDSLEKYGEDSVIPGGNAQRFYPPTMIEVRQGKVIKESTIPVGQSINWTVKKSKTAAPKVTGEVEFKYASGFEVNKSLIDVATEMEIIEQHGAFYTVLGEQVRGKEQLYKLLADNKEFLDNLWKQVYANMGREIWDGSPQKIKEENETEIS